MNNSLKTISFKKLSWRVYSLCYKRGEGCLKNLKGSAYEGWESERDVLRHDPTSTIKRCIKVLFRRQKVLKWLYVRLSPRLFAIQKILSPISEGTYSFFLSGIAFEISMRYFFQKIRSYTLLTKYKASIEFIEPIRGFITSFKVGQTLLSPNAQNTSFFVV